MKNFLCRFGWHSWSTWELVYAKDWGLWETRVVQKRRCQCCGKYQYSMRFAGR